MFSGDQLNGQKTSYDSRSVLAKFASPVIDRKIPWAAIFGACAIRLTDNQATTIVRLPRTENYRSKRCRTCHIRWLGLGPKMSTASGIVSSGKALFRF